MEFSYRTAKFEDISVIASLWEEFIQEFMAKDPYFKGKVLFENFWKGVILILKGKNENDFVSLKGEAYIKNVIKSMFKKLNEEGITIVMVTHEPEIAEQTKRVITFKDGVIISDNITGS